MIPGMVVHVPKGGIETAVNVGAEPYYEIIVELKNVAHHLAIATCCGRTGSVTATWKLEFPYRRSVGPVIGAFLTALRDRKVVGVRTTGGTCSSRPSSTTPTPATPSETWSRSVRRE